MTAHELVETVKETNPEMYVLQHTKLMETAVIPFMYMCYVHCVTCVFMLTDTNAWWHGVHTRF